MDAAILTRENALLKARLAEVEAALAESQEANRRLEDILRTSQRAQFGKRSEKLSPDQFSLPLEDAELAQGVLAAAQEKAEAQPWASAVASAPGRARDRACQHPVSLRLRRDGPDRRGYVRASRRDPRPGPGAGHTAPQIRLPPLLAGRGAGAGTRACRARRAAHGTVHRRSPSGLNRWRRNGSPSCPSSATTCHSTERPRSSSGRVSTSTVGQWATGSAGPVST